MNDTKPPYFYTSFKCFKSRWSFQGKWGFEFGAQIESALNICLNFRTWQSKPRVPISRSIFYVASYDHQELNIYLGAQIEFVSTIWLYFWKPATQKPPILPDTLFNFFSTVALAVFRQILIRLRNLQIFKRAHFVEHPVCSESSARLIYGDLTVIVFKGRNEISIEAGKWWRSTAFSVW